jgi:mannose-6-phosphate isomerase-like protein (cupin superfamily)
MRTPCLALIFAFIPAVAPAQTPAPPDRPFASAAEVAALIENAKRERKPDQPNFVQPIVSSTPFRANLEHRVAGVNAPASVHERDAELFYVVEGAGTIVTGGTLRGERRTNPENLSGTGIDGGTRQRIARGDFVLVPENTPHWFGVIDGTLVLMSIHLPRPAGP